MEVQKPTFFKQEISSEKWDVKFNILEWKLQTESLEMIWIYIQTQWIFIQENGVSCYIRLKLYIQGKHIES